MNPAGNNTLCCCKCNNSFLLVRTPCIVAPLWLKWTWTWREEGKKPKHILTWAFQSRHVTNPVWSSALKKKKHPKKNCCCSITSKCCCFAFIPASCCWCPQQNQSTPHFFSPCKLFHLNVSRQTSSCSRSNLQGKRNNNPPKKGICLFLLLFCMQTIIWDRSACKRCHYHELIMWIFYFVLSYPDSVISKHKVVSSLLTFLHFSWWTIVYFFRSKD